MSPMEPLGVPPEPVETPPPPPPPMVPTMGIGPTLDPWKNTTPNKNWEEEALKAQEMPRFGTDRPNLPHEPDDDEETDSSFAASPAPVVPDVFYEPSINFAMRPVPPGATVQCRITRDKGYLGYPVYECLTKDGKAFLMSARKRKKSKTANYFISLDKDTSKDGPSNIAKVRAIDGMMMSGSQYVVYRCLAGHEEDDKEELAFVEFAPRSFMSSNFNFGEAATPMELMAFVPSVNQEGKRNVVPGGVASSNARGKGKSDKVVELKNKEPKLNPTTGQFTLDFGGRVTMSSVKNVQLTMPGDDQVVLQFGKNSATVFSMDVQYPMSPAQGFGICLGILENGNRSSTLW